MRPIDADALFRKVKTECNPYGKPTIGFEDGKRVLNWIEQAPTVGGWISVKDRLPEQVKTVLVARKYVQPCHKERRYVETAELIGTSWVSIEDEYKMHLQFHTLPYAWMPLPEPPKEEHDEP